MSINPVSDIVLDVARAADPVNSQAAEERLLRAAAASPSFQGEFDRAFSNAGAGRAALTKAMESGGTKPSAVLPQVDARTKAYKGLEQLVLKNLLESMLPKESFGEGTAGDIWRSMLADQLATQIGKNINLGSTPVGFDTKRSQNAIKHQL